MVTVYSHTLISLHWNDLFLVQIEKLFKCLKVILLARIKSISTEEDGLHYAIHKRNNNGTILVLYISLIITHFSTLVSLTLLFVVLNLT